MESLLRQNWKTLHVRLRFPDVCRPGNSGQTLHVQINPQIHIFHCTFHFFFYDLFQKRLRFAKLQSLLRAILVAHLITSQMKLPHKVGPLVFCILGISITLEGAENISKCKLLSSLSSLLPPFFTRSKHT